MEANKRMYVFDKKEILLIFVLIILISTTCFVFGVKIGKTYSLDVQGVTNDDIQRVDLLSQKEESLIEDEKKLEEIVKKAQEDSKLNENIEGNSNYERLKEKIDNEVLRDNEVTILDNTEKKNEKLTSANIAQTSESASNTDKQISGKWTIQLGSHQNTEDAEAFADGFRVRGYRPIINQVYLGDRGVWFRVSLGLFPSIVDAKNYVIENQSLFDGQDYVFIQFD